MAIRLRQNLLSGMVFYESLLSEPTLAVRTVESIARSPRAPESIAVEQAYIDTPEDIVLLLNRVFFRNEAHHDLASWALMRCVGYAEHQVIQNATRISVGEEHITGQFFQAIRDALAGLRFQVRDADAVPLSFADANVTGDRAERLTGGDMGLIVRTVDNAGNSIFKSAVIQAKKADADGFANCRHTTRSTGVQQIARLRAVQGLGHYIFYHVRNAAGIVLPPTMCSADAVAASGAIQRFNATSEPTVTAAAYIAYMLAGREDSQVGALTFSPEDAARSVFAGLEEPHAAANRVTVFDTSTTGRMSWDQWRQYLAEAQQREQHLRSLTPRINRSPGQDSGQTGYDP